MKIPLDGQAILLEKMAAEYTDYIDLGITNCPKEFVYKISSKDESSDVVRAARVAAMAELNSGQIKKYAFDTRRIDQEWVRNPRVNLQYWHRANEFIDSDDQSKLTTFANLMSVLNDLKAEFGSQPEWFESYSRVLYDNVERILRIKQADLDIFKPQLTYLEQLIFARYRMSVEDLSKFGREEIRARILSKDEALLKRGDYLKQTGGIVKDSDNNKNDKQIVIDGNKTTQESIVNAIFGGTGMRRDGEKNVTRTITITINDKVTE
jgi:hypothetical protein